MPSAPRSNQNRSTSSNSARTAGFAQLKSGCSGANRCRYHSPEGETRVQAGPPKIDCQSFGGRSPDGPRPGRNQNRSRSAEPGRSRKRGPKPRMLIRAVVRDDVDDDPNAERVRLGDERVCVRQRAEDRVDVPVIGDVVTRVRHRRRVPRVEPDRVDAEPSQVGQVRAHAGEIADPVPVPVGEAAHVQLVDGGAAPPGAIWHGNLFLCVPGRDHPRRPPAVRPAMMLRWKNRKKTIVGTAAMADAAMIRFCGVPYVACQMPTFRVSLVGV